VTTSLTTMSVCHVVISTATMTSSLRTRAENEIDTMLRNSDSNRMSDASMMAPPAGVGEGAARVSWERGGEGQGEAGAPW